MPIDVTEFRALGQRALGNGWVYRLARATGRDKRTAQRWASGRFTPPDDVVAFLREQAALAPALRDRLRAVAEDAAGLHPVAVAGALRDLAVDVAGDEEASDPARD